MQYVQYKVQLNIISTKIGENPGPVESGFRNSIATFIWLNAYRIKKLAETIPRIHINLIKIRLGSYVLSSEMSNSIIIQTNNQILLTVRCNISDDYSIWTWGT